MTCSLSLLQLIFHEVIKFCIDLSLTSNVSDFKTPTCPSSSAVMNHFLILLFELLKLCSRFADLHQITNLMI